MILPRWTFLLLAFSLPLEYPNRFAYEVTTMTGTLFLVAAALQPQVCFGRVPGAMLCFGLFLNMLLVSLVTQGTTYPGGLYLPEVLKLFQFLCLWVLVFWAASNLLRQERMRRAALWALVLGCLVRAVLPFTDWARTARVQASGGERVTVLGQSANQSAQILAVGLLAMIGLVYLQGRVPRRARIPAWGAVALLLLSLVQTGSRGGLLSLCVGLLVFLAAGGALRTWMRNAVVGVLALGLVIAFAATSEVVRGRLALVQEGNLANRELLYPALVAMFREKPWLGWGPITNKYELALRVGESGQSRVDTHNVVLEIVTAAGLLGALPFLLGTGLCLRAAWSARAGPEAMVPFAMLAAVLVGNMTQNRIAGPLLWLTLAYALASGSREPVPAAARSASAPGPGRAYSRVPVWQG